MKRINLHLIAIVLSVLFLLGYNWQYGNETFVFFGFAENRETEIRLENPVIIDAVNVSAGSKVLKGEVLLEATRASLELATSDLNHEVAKTIEILASDLLDDKHLTTVNLTTSYMKNIDVPCFKIDNHIIWGATGMMLSEIKELLNS